MRSLKDNWFAFDDVISLSKALGQEILNIAEKSIFEKGCFNIVLTGGQSALNLYKILSEFDSTWSKWHIYIGDERFLPMGHNDRNDKIINEIWLDNSTIPKKNIHFIKAELGLLEARSEYEGVLKKIDKFDVVLLSMGEDGHIASLFPGHTYSKEKMVVIEYCSPKPPKERISMSYAQLNKATNVFKLIIGKSKQGPLDLLKKGISLPISKVYKGRERFFISVNN